MDLIERAAKEAKEKALAKAKEKAQKEAQKIAQAALMGDSNEVAGDKGLDRFKSIGKKKKRPIKADPTSLTAVSPQPEEKKRRSLNDPVETALTKGVKGLSRKSNKAVEYEKPAISGVRSLGGRKKKPVTENASPKPDPTDLSHVTKGISKPKPAAKKNHEDALLRRAQSDPTAFKPPSSRNNIAEKPEKSEKPAQGKGRPQVKKSEIDLSLLRERGFITPDMPTNLMSEEFRIIKRSLLLNAFGAESKDIENSNVIMLTSSNPNEGKTFCSINLALSIATEQDTTVLLIDADFNKPEILNRLGMRGGKGFMDVVADKDLTIADCLLRTNVDNLVIMPAGRQHNRTTELLASERMKEIVKELSTRYPDRLIIFDAPPSLASSVPSVMSMYIGQTVYVIAAEETSELMIKEGLTLINKCKNINLLLNKTRMGSGNKKFATYYGYGRR